MINSHFGILRCPLICVQSSLLEQQLELALIAEKAINVEKSV